ncbi:MAG TPA: phosphoribosylformylglycinamidine synthase subunit PurQ, partial [Candidatus Saccharimonadia bacterium]|nr:phosphoribosylformylglycinamidine synthase subunit PurQ [Candidatus Saccharimonadia bacterium]
VAMADTMVALGMAVDGGKDSLSMAAQRPGGLVKAPGQLVVAPYAVTEDVRRAITPDLKSESSRLMLIDLSGGRTRLGGSALAQAFGQIGNEVPDLEDVELLNRTFKAVQKLNAKGLVRALHDRSDGGLVVCAIEMALAGNLGLELELPAAKDEMAALFNEELGLVIEVADSDVAAVTKLLDGENVPHAEIGRVGKPGAAVRISAGGQELLNQPLHQLRGLWEATSTQLDRRQANPESVESESAILNAPRVAPDWKLTYQPAAGLATTPKPGSGAPKVAVVREEGNNSDREMAAAFAAAGFDAWDVNTYDLATGKVTLDQFRGVVFPGGFSFGDVLDSGKGAAAVIKYNPVLAEQFAAFHARKDTFSLGVCNGAQLMAFLGWAPFAELPDDAKPRFIHNASGRFESRFVSLEIQESPAIMFAGMAGSRLGAWVAHGEGRVHVPKPETMKQIVAGNLAPLRFVEPGGGATERYPFNPNGSPQGITGLCSPDGRHLAIMPHPERSANAMWQWPWLPEGWSKLPASPWLRMFQNAYAWCQKN